MRDYEGIIADIDAKLEKKRATYNNMTKEQLVNIIVNYEDYIVNQNIELCKLRRLFRNRA